MPDGAIGSTTDSGSVDSRFESWSGIHLTTDPTDRTRALFSIRLNEWPSPLIAALLRFVSGLIPGNEADFSDLEVSFDQV
jgi:hypothetical protein